MFNFKDVTDFIFSIKNKELLNDFLFGITTEKERKELTLRLEIIKRLISGEPQAKISKELGVGIATVTRGSKELNQGRFKILRQK